MAKAKLSNPRILNFGPLHCAAVSSDGAWIATGSDLGAFLWSTRKRAPVSRCLLSRPEGKDVHGHSVESAAFSPDGSTVVLGTMGSELWSGSVAEMGDEWPLEKWEQRAHYQPIRSLGFSANGERLVACQQYGRVVVWEPAARRPVLEIDFSAFAWACACLSSDGRLVAVCSEEKAQVWEVDAQVMLAETTLVDNPDGTTQPVFSPDGAVLMLPGSRTVVQWCHGDDTVETVLETDEPRAIHNLPDIGYAAFSGSLLRGVRAGTLEEVFLQELGQAPNGVVCSANGRTMVVLDWSENPRVVEVPGGDGFPLAAHNGFIRQLAFSASGESFLLVAGGSFSSYFEEVACVGGRAGAEVGQILRRRASLPEEPFLLHASLPGGGLWIYRAGEPDPGVVAKWPEERRDWICARLGFAALAENDPAFIDEANDAVFAGAVSPDGARVALCVDQRGALLLVDPRTPKLVARLRGPGHLGRVEALDFSADGSWLASGGEDKSARVWDLEQREMRQTWRLHKQRVTCVAMAPSGNLLASGSPDKSVYLMRVGDSEPVHRFRCGDAVNHLVFSPDGELLIVATEAHVEVWNVKTGKRDARGSSHWTSVVAINGTGNLIATGSRTLRLWELTRS
jgi:WD40 repeat protein